MAEVKVLTALVIVSLFMKPPSISAFFTSFSPITSTRTTHRVRTSTHFHIQSICSSIQDTPQFSTTRTNDCNNPQKIKNTIHLISIPHLSDDAPRIVRDVWKWKDIVLGDGRDYFVPRPRALKALSDVIVGTACEEYTVTECAILSNCARMDVLLSLERVTKTATVVEGPIGSVNPSKDGIIQNGQAAHLIADEVAGLVVADCINSQLGSFQSQRRAPLMESVSSFLDLPGLVCKGETSENKSTSDNGLRNNDKSKHLASLLNGTSARGEIVTHFSKVAAGMAPRASRPDRPVLFRPFSSRDAHIMLQLKRTAEVASQYPKMKIILDAALSAGKAARDTKQCPVLNKLKGYDGEGKYSQAAPPQLANEVAEEVIELAIEPAVQRSIERLNAYESSDKIVTLRQRAKELCDDRDWEREKLVNKMLHGPCMEIRNGKTIDLEKVLADIEVKLKDTATRS